ncbi:MAG: DUF3299 domain-containing protein [Bacteroidota bacterium]
MQPLAGRFFGSWPRIVTSGKFAASFLMLWFSLCMHAASAQSMDGWEHFARVKFTEKYFKDQNDYYLVPLLDAKIKALQGKEVLLRGHYIPMEMEKGSVMLSKFPYSQCFFCGGAGPESVAEVIFKDKVPRFKPDQIITVRGTLSLNDTDVMHMNFILRNATLAE